MIRVCLETPCRKDANAHLHSYQKKFSNNKSIRDTFQSLSLIWTSPRLHVTLGGRHVLRLKETFVRDPEICKGCSLGYAYSTTVFDRNGEALPCS